MSLLVFQKYKAFAYASELMIGLVYVIIAVLTIYYGHQVSLVFENKSTNENSENKQTSNKVSIY
jgi:hypothetical protein